MIRQKREVHIFTYTYIHDRVYNRYEGEVLTDFVKDLGGSNGCTLAVDEAKRVSTGEGAGSVCVCVCEGGDDDDGR